MKKFLALVLALVLALSLAACSGGAGYQIGIPADATNGGRALLLLQDLGILTLKEGVGLEATEQDIVENPHNVTIKAMEAATCPPACRTWISPSSTATTPPARALGIRCSRQRTRNPWRRRPTAMSLR